MGDLERIKPIFSEALGKQGHERHAFLDMACRQDPELRPKIEALLKAHEGAQDFLKTPPFAGQVNADDASLAEGPGTMVGPYKLLEKIGEGGMAVVYQAEQERPIRRQVALKIIKLGMDTAQVVARFEAERQALALMNHASIAKIFEAGATEAGRPYFVMELVEGISFTEYCDQHGLSTRQRLELFAEACRAVKHAHDKGIIHRDIKPTNVLITQQDGQPVPKVIDFGIAKATNMRLTERTLYTREAQILGTPEYMSPEQATFGDSALDGRTDVYSLGVLLYHLLTGVSPYQDTQFRDASYPEICRIIRETEPQRPSTRLMQERHPANTQNRIPKIEIDRDLDWIVMRALEKEPERRYQTVEALTSDIGRYLRHEPVQAGPPSLWHRLRRLVGRHQLRWAAVLLLAAGLLMGATAATLRVLHLRPTGTGAHAAGMVQRHIWDFSSGAGGGGTLSRDGRYLSYVDWSAGNLGLLDLRDKTSWLLTSNITDREGWNQDSAVSGDGQWIAYNWHLEAEGFYDLRVIGRHGNAMRILYHDPNTFLIKPHAWSPDGRAVLAYFSAMELDLIDEGTQERYRRGRLVLVTVADGSVRVLQAWDRQAYPKRAVFSPDGNRIAYDLEQGDQGFNSEHDIFVYDLRTGQTSTAVAHPADDKLLGWTPGQDRLLFQSNRSASGGLWLVDLVDASPQSTPILLKNESPRGALGLTENGSLYYRVPTSARDVYLVQLDAGGLNFAEAPQLVSTRAVGTTAIGVWSPDGTVLAHRIARDRTGGNIIGAGGNWVFSLYSPQTGQARLLEPDPPFPKDAHMCGPQYSPDGNALLVYMGGGERERGVYEIDCRTGQTRRLWTAVDQPAVCWPLWSPDGRLLYISGKTLIQVDPVTEEQKTLYQGPVRRIAISPDGYRLAFWRDRSSLVILPVSGGPPQEVLRLKADELNGHFAFVTWMPDNQHLLFPKLGHELWRVNIQTGQQQQIDGPLEHLAHVDVHPDGRQLAFTIEQAGSELWAMEGFLPDP